MLNLEDVVVLERLQRELTRLEGGDAGLVGLFLAEERLPRGVLDDPDPGEAGLLLGSPLVRPLVLVVDAAEVGDDDGDGKGDHQHSRQRTNPSHQLSHDRRRDHVAISVISNLYLSLSQCLVTSAHFHVSLFFIQAGWCFGNLADW